MMFYGRAGSDAGGTAGSPDDGLEASGFTLVETGVDSGIFTGSFQVPSTYYDSPDLNNYSKYNRNRH